MDLTYSYNKRSQYTQQTHGQIAHGSQFQYLISPNRKCSKAFRWFSDYVNGSNKMSTCNCSWVYVPGRTSISCCSCVEHCFSVCQPIIEWVSDWEQFCRCRNHFAIRIAGKHSLSTHKYTQQSTNSPSFIFAYPLWCLTNCNRRATVEAPNFDGDCTSESWAAIPNFVCKSRQSTQTNSNSLYNW